MRIDIEPIGIIHSPFKKKEDISTIEFSSSNGFDDVEGEIEILKKYEKGLKDIEGFSHLIIIYLFHKIESYSLHVKPYLDKNLRGVFSTRHPKRPNKIGFTIVKLLERKKNILKVKGIDMLNGSPVLDIKPYTYRDIKDNVKIGWLEGLLNKY